MKFRLVIYEDKSCCLYTLEERLNMLKALGIKEEEAIFFDFELPNKETIGIGDEALKYLDIFIGNG